MLIMRRPFSLNEQMTVLEIQKKSYRNNEDKIKLDEKKRKKSPDRGIILGKYDIRPITQILST